MSPSLSPQDLMRYLVSYEEAAHLLGIQKQSLANAISRGVLTPLPRRNNKQRGFLARQQVDLFLSPTISGDKKALTLNDLTNNEAAQWHEIHRAILSMTPNSHSRQDALLEGEIPQDVEVSDIEIAVDLIERLSMLAADIIEEMVIEGKVTEYSPENLITFITSSDKFKQVLSLMGIKSYAHMSSESLNRINEAAIRVSEKFMLRVSQMMLAKAMQEGSMFPQMMGEETGEGVSA